MTLQGFVEDLDDDSGVLNFQEGETVIRRVFDRDFLDARGITRVGQPVELKIVLEAGDPKVVLRALATPEDMRPFEIVPGFDYSQF